MRQLNRDNAFFRQIALEQELHQHGIAVVRHLDRLAQEGLALLAGKAGCDDG